MIDKNDPRTFFDSLTTLCERLEEPAPGRIQLLVGPRQVGKTTLLLRLAERIGDRAVYFPADGPEASVPGSWERLWDLAGDGAPCVVFLDEVHHIPNWSARLKSEWDRIVRTGTAIQIVASGSSALGLARGSRESLAGRFERLQISHWSAATIAREFDLSEREAVERVIRGGTYPGAQDLWEDPARWLAYVRDAIVEPAVGRDILAMVDVRKPGLLRQVFSIAASSPAEIVSLKKIQGSLQDRGALETISHYLALLEDAWLVAGLPKYSNRAIRRRASPPKLVPLSNAIAATADPRGTPDPASDPARFGRWVENACIAHAWNSGQRVHYWREANLEVDAVIDGSWGAWAVEVKTGPFTGSDLSGLFEFTRRNPRFRPLILCDEKYVSTAGRLGLTAMDYRAYLASDSPEP